MGDDFQRANPVVPTMLTMIVTAAVVTSTVYHLTPTDTETFGNPAFAEKYQKVGDEPFGCGM